MRYQVLGPVTSFADGDRVALGGPKQRLVLALLLGNPGRSVPLDRLIDGVWAGDPPDHARHTLHSVDPNGLATVTYAGRIHDHP